MPTAFPRRPAPSAVLAIARAAARAACALCCLAAGLAAPPPADARPPARQTVTLPAQGVRAPVEILVDAWGIPHIYAKNFDDAFFAQGFNAARDRLWQMDLWRKRGLGEMAKDFGPAYVEGDRMARAFLFRGDLYREWLAYGSDAKRVAEDFVAGVNAFVALTEERPELLPVEFKRLGYRPARWKAEDVVRIRHHGLTLNFSSEVDRAAAYCLGGEKVDWLRRELDPPIAPTVPEGLDVCALPVAELKRAYSLATAPARFSRESLTRAADAPLESLYAVASDTDAEHRGYGSNNWTIAPSRTSTGRAILANDPHRAHGTPSLRYIAHLVAPGFDVIGAGEPFLPGISIGHNGHIAFGLTRFYMDQEDLYVYELNPANPDEYKYRGRYEPMTVVTEDVAVKGEAPRKVTIKFTRHGPVLHVEAAKGRAYALRAAWLEPGMAPYFGSMDYMRARDWDQFRAAMNRWGAPGENQVFADRSGHIGWIPGGLTPIRPNWDGLFPVPGDGRYEWAGFRDMDDLPSEFDPPRGYVVTANENNIPSAHPAAKKGIGYEWSDSTRSRRLKGLFAGHAGRFTLEDSLRMQTDTVNVQARRVVRLLQPLKSDDARVQEGLALLKGWDGSEDRDSAPAALYEVWFSKHLRPAVVKAALGEAGAKLVGAGDATRVVLLLEDPSRYLSAEARDAVMLASLKSAIEEVSTRLGPDMKAWKWGALHYAAFMHPLSAVLDQEEQARFNVGRWPLGGSAFTPMATAYRNSDFMLTSGASFRMVLDMGRWDASRVVNTPGQSGDPASAHYRDLAPIWAAGQYVPLLYTRKAVQGAAQSRIVLEPVK